MTQTCSSSVCVKSCGISRILALCMLSNHYDLSRSQSPSHWKWTHRGYARVERSKAERIKQRVGRCHRGHAIAHGPEPPHTNPTPPGTRTGHRAPQALSRHVDRGLPTMPPSPTSPSANSYLTTDSSGILSTWPRRGAVRPPAHAGDPAQVGVVGADERLQLVVREAAGLRYSVEKGWDDVDADSMAHVCMLPGRRSAGSRAGPLLPSMHMHVHAAVRPPGLVSSVCGRETRVSESSTWRVHVEGGQSCACELRGAL
eukprot:25681-Chlamydomonas_euryale.AAC.4